MMALTSSTFAGTPVLARAQAKRATGRTAAVAPQANTYPEFGASPYDDPTYSKALWPKWAEGKTPETMERARQFELMHARWAMMGCAGAWAAEKGTGIPWFQAGKVCTPADCTAVNSIFPGQVAGLAPEGSGFPSFYIVAGLTFVMMFLSEAYRTGIIAGPFSELEVGDVHPGGEHFDPLGLATQSSAFEFEKMKLAELKNGRLAMFSFLGYIAQAFATNHGEGLPSFQEGAVGPYGNWLAHVSDPVANNLWTETGIYAAAPLKVTSATELISVFDPIINN